MALSHLNVIIDIYSNSWGPSDNGNIVDGPGRLTQMALEQAAREVSNNCIFSVILLSLILCIWVLTCSNEMLGQSGQLETTDVFTLSNCSFALKGIKPGPLTYLLSWLEVSSDIGTKTINTSSLLSCPIIVWKYCMVALHLCSCWNPLNLLHVGTGWQGFHLHVGSWEWWKGWLMCSWWLCEQYLHYCHWCCTSRWFCCFFWRRVFWKDGHYFCQQARQKFWNSKQEYITYTYNFAL